MLLVLLLVLPLLLDAGSDVLGRRGGGASVDALLAQIGLFGLARGGALAPLVRVLAPDVPAQAPDEGDHPRVPPQAHETQVRATTQVLGRGAVAPPQLEREAQRDEARPDEVVLVEDVRELLALLPEQGSSEPLGPDVERSHECRERLQNVQSSLPLLATHRSRSQENELKNSGRREAPPLQRCGRRLPVPGSGALAPTRCRLLRGRAQLDGRARSSRHRLCRRRCRRHRDLR